MQHLRAFFLAFIALAAVFSLGAAERGQTNRFEFKDGDRIVFLGDTFFERENNYGEIELLLTTLNPGKKLIFRNIAWSADTPVGESRAYFDPPEKGFERLKEHLKTIKPTVAFVSYGMAASLQGPAGLDRFRQQMGQMIAAVEDASRPEPVRFVLLGPVPHEKLPEPMPDPGPHQISLQKYEAAIREIAAEKRAAFVSLEPLLGGSRNFGVPLTDNGIHLNELGYRRAAHLIAETLKLGANRWRFSITAQGEPRDGVYGIIATNIQRTSSSVRFNASMEHVPLPVLDGFTNDAPFVAGPPFLQFLSLNPGLYTLRIDGSPVATFTGAEWNRSVFFHGGPDYVQGEELKKTIIEKNELYFHRWRPQNETYLFGFRRHEQGQNAREIPMFDPLVAEKEQKIQQLARPVSRRYELTQANDSEPTGLVKRPTPPRDKGSAALIPKKDQPVPTFEVGEGLEVTLWAENPLLAKPIQMNFDPQGRLWVASSEVYPQIQPGQKASDKIILIEDGDGDGKADRSTIFADGLLIPTGVEPGDGGVYVGQSTELLHFRDTDGDGRADKKRVVLSGFGTEDTHHILHTLRWGHDGQLYMNQSVYIHSHIETPHGVVRLNSGGGFNFRTTTHELGIHFKGLWNSWGLHFDRYGQTFLTDGAGNQGIHHVVPQAQYVAYAGARRVLESISPGSYPKYCGLEVIESEHFPEDWQGTMVTCDFRAHRVVRFAVSERGSSYVTKELPDLLRTTNVTFRPIDVKLGPDGALYIADWSNPIIQHGEVDFRDPRRDHEHGRIWRVSAKGREPNKKVQFAQLNTRGLLNELESPNNYDRQRARRLLAEKGPDISSDVRIWARERTNEVAQMEALWVYQSIGFVNVPHLERMLVTPDGRVRAAATRVLGEWLKKVPSATNHLERLVADSHPRVRMEAVRALGKTGTLRGAELALSVLDTPMDPYLEYAVWLTINELAEPWVAGLQQGRWQANGREKQLEFGLQAIEPALAGRALDKLLADNPIPNDGSGPWIDLIGKAGSPAHLSMLQAKVTARALTDSAQVKALNALASAARVRNTRPSGYVGSAAELLRSENAQVRAAALQLAAAWKVESTVEEALKIAAEPQASAEVRAAAFQLVREVGGKNALPKLATLAGEPQSAAVRRQATLAIAGIDPAAAVQPAAAALAATQDENEAAQFWRSLLAVRGVASPLARAVSQQTLTPLVARAGMRVAREAGRNEPELVLALARNLDTAGEIQELTPAEMQALAAKVSQSGNAARGEQIYRRPELACVACHAIGGIGGKVGPDLTSIGASAPMDYIIESLLFPNRKIKEGYHAVSVETNDGEEITGVIVRETNDQLFVRDAGNREVALPKNNIKERNISGSLMPAGLIDPLAEQERTDLIRFLSELGKPGPYDASRGNTARLWKITAATSEMAQFGDEAALGKSLGEKMWEQAFTLVDGRLRRAQLQNGLERVKWRQPTAVYAATRFNAPKDGPVRLSIKNAPKGAAWLNGKAIAVQEQVVVELPAGMHTLVFKIEGKDFPEELVVRSDDATFLTEF
ncbi:MAG TPA: PVC-type heme-binding CxxCH protein [Methylomirabilota bacterium]|nr:PVC-type heme-binding CxxCH protein [Methylomirabilota bacterium]